MAAVNFHIQTNAIEARHFFDSLSRQHIPFAMSRAVNALAFQAREGEQKKLGTYFDLRTGWLLSNRAMPIVPSKKSQLPNIHAILGVKDEIAALAATGGTKKGRGGDLGIPMPNTGGGTSTREALNPGRRTLGPSKWPSRIVKGRGKRPRRNKTGMVLLNKAPSPFILKGKSGRTFVARRAGKDAGRGDRLEILYELKPSVQVGKLWPLMDNVAAMVGRRYDAELEIQLNAAVKSARKSGLMGGAMIMKSITR